MAALEEQVKIEFQASLQYILMAAHFDQVSQDQEYQGLIQNFW